MNISYDVLRKEDIPAAAKILAESFCNHNAPTVHLKMKVEEMHDYSVSLCENVVDEELSMVAKTSDGTVVACFIAHGFNSEFPSPAKAYSENIVLIYDFLNTLDSQAFLHLPAFDRAKCTIDCLAGIDPAFGGRGIIKQLIIQAHDHHRKKGYEHIYVQFTNPITMSIYESLEAYESIKLHSLAYEEYIYAAPQKTEVEDNRIPSYKPFLGLPGTAWAVYLRAK